MLHNLIVQFLLAVIIAVTLFVATIGLVTSFVNNVMPHLQPAAPIEQQYVFPVDML